ncbi:TetR/AcrR family transcriptional regulator [Caproicibacterium sp. BJN0003]|uniref:TetR/AcrR family transcriptional regulator n=1 Tax=Caproicibacterium sp. BJN0003 TaxID=2994078 RepID=UPI00224CACA6|nr:TetR/AcrR family transcriptional regulator [Caproicibacterium sp. BJN0003]UZT81789.1 TetR/AcrR family transcriptional regulator [Caproicibacterium sp. BJN0003]
MDKRNLILDAMLDLLEKEKGAACSVSDIAKRAGIGKGSIYYYFQSKDEIFDALVEREYGQVIQKCEELVHESRGDAILKLKLLFQSYRSSVSSPAVDAYLHQQQNAAIHQKSLAKILLSLSPIVADIIRQGVKERLFCCDKPQETAEIIVSVYCFLYDQGIFIWTPQQLKNKEIALADLLENGLSSAKGSFQFLYGE